MFANVYDDDARAEAYDGLEFPGTYYLAYRDLPGIFARHANGRKALDFGCGTGRSTRFLRRCGFDVTGLEPVAIHRPLGDPTEPYPWVTATRVAPWVIHVSRCPAQSGAAPDPTRESVSKSS